MPKANLRPHPAARRLDLVVAAELVAGLLRSVLLTVGVTASAWRMPTMPTRRRPSATTVIAP
jgi:hypothetical protein